MAGKSESGRVARSIRWVSVGLAGANVIALLSAEMFLHLFDYPPFWSVIAYLANALILVVAPLALVGLIVAAAIDAFVESKH